MIVVDIHPDGFKSVAKTQQDQRSRGSKGPGVRRPTRGIVLKEDTFATIKVITSSGKVQSLVDAGSRDVNANNEPLEIAGKRATSVYSNFLVQQVNEERAEKAQILETFGEPYIFLFGERARVITVHGILANTWDFNWEAEWWENYDLYLRGTKCVENDAMVFLQFDDTLVGGYIIGSNAAKTAQERNFVQFTFQMFVTFQTNLSQVGKADLPTMDASAASYEFTKTGIDATLSEEEAAVMRPPLIYPSQYAVQGKVDGASGLLEQPDLFASVMQFAVNPLKKAWTLANDAVSKVTSQLESMISTGVVQVPYGFAGSMAYDEVDLSSQIQAVKVGGTATYSTFSANDDEYVDTATQYGDSDTNLFRAEESDPDGWDGTLGSSNIKDDIYLGQVVSDRAAGIWEDAGHDIPDDAYGPMGGLFSQGVAKGGMGMVKIRGVMGEEETQDAAMKSGLNFKSIGYQRIINGVGAAAMSGVKLPGWF